MKRYIFFAFALLVLASISCKKDNNQDNEPTVTAAFSHTIDGLFVVFSNSSQSATEYEWDFGDQTVGSKDKNPSHTYVTGGEFVVSLTAKNGNQTNVTKQTINVSPKISIVIDGDFTDWEHVNYTLVNPENEGGTLRAIKSFVSASHIGFYLEGTSEMTMESLDIFIDTDNNPATGFIPSEYTAGAGAELLLEGAPASGMAYKHSGAQDAWSFSPVYSFLEIIKFSDIKSQGDRKVVEFAIERSRLGTLKDAISLCLMELDSARWTDRKGSIPVRATAESKFLKVML